MGRDPSDAIQSLRERLENGERGDTDEAREALLEMSDTLHLVPSEVGDYRHRDILRQATRIAEEVGGDTLLASLEDRDATEEIVRWINSEYDKETTNQTYRKNLRAWGRYAGEMTDDPPESIDWVPSGTSNDYDPVPSERDLVTKDEIDAMTEAARNPRDKALIQVQFEAGLRSGELQSLRVGDVFDGEHTVGVHADGKQGERPVHLMVSVPYLQRWLVEHPAGDDPDAPLWSKLDAPETPSATTFLNYFKRPAEAAGVSKSVTPTNLRKSNTRWLVRRGYGLPRIEDRQGREKGSDHTANYLARFSDESLERSYAALHGEEIESEDPDEVSPVTCPRCERETPRDRDRCMWCSFALSHDAAEEARDERKEALAVAGELAGRDDLDSDAVVETIDRLIDERVEARLEQNSAHD